MHIHDAFLPGMIQMLKNIGAWLDEAEAAGLDMETILAGRLADDMFTFTRQVQSACDTAKFAAARLSGRDAPKHADDEKTVAEVRARLASVLEYLGGFSPEDFDGYEDRVARPGWLGGKGMRAEDYVMQFAVPNFYFHASIAYGILRQAGLPLGKTKYIGHITVVE